MNRAPLALPEADLRTLAAALRSGRIAAPFSQLALQRLLGAHAPVDLAEWMSGVVASGCGAAPMAMWLDVLADSVRERTPVEHAVHLVTTAPEGTAAVHRDTAVVVQDLFRRVRRSLVISTYGVYGGREIFRTLAERMNADESLSTRMFFNAHGRSIANAMQHFREHQWPANSRLPEVYVDIRSSGAGPAEAAVLHAKCILIDSEEIFVTSANITDAAQHRNVEVGVLVRSAAITEQALRFFDSLVRSGFCARAG